MVRKKQLAAKSKVVHGEEPDSSELGKSPSATEKGSTSIKTIQKKEEVSDIKWKGKDWK